MADNLKGIPFSTDDEGISYPDQAKAAVVMATNLDEEPLSLDEIYVVWFSYTLGNWKALLSTSRPDGRYFEVIHDAKKDCTYVDFYLKIGQEVIFHTVDVEHIADIVYKETPTS